MRVLIEPGLSKNVIATIAIGREYYTLWEKYALPSWRKYCERHQLGLIVFDSDLISKENKYWKKATWQKMLIGEILKNSSITVENVCYLDTDILINHKAPNIFESYDSETIALVSQINNLPASLDTILRRIAFLRHNHYDPNYPLDSALFMSLKQVYNYHNVPIQKDYACMGLFVFNVKNHSGLMNSWFQKYDRHVHSLTSGGDQSHINYEMQNWGKIFWLDYKFQALWIYEMAWKYPFLYDFGRDNEALIRECVEACLYSNYFLHFAGSWYESDMWKIGGVFEGAAKTKILDSYYEYLKMPVTGEPKGQIKPNPDKREEIKVQSSKKK